jgi:prevent-host-death family protein
VDRSPRAIVAACWRARCVSSDHNGRVRFSLATAKAKLSQLIRAARDQKEVVITDHGRPVARLVPYEQTEETLDERIRSLRERGHLLVATGSPRDPWPEPTIIPGALARFVDERDEP